LNDYISTIFQKSPLLEPPFFRGFYFTSSVQEGTPIFDVFAKTRGASVVEVAATKTVESKAFFIHDFYEKKVFPEQGLVFRSAKHVTLNKRMRRMVWMGSTAMAGLMLLFVIVGGLNFRSLLTKPLDDCANAADYYPSPDESRPKKSEASFADLKGNITKAKALAGHIEKYTGFKRALSARMMFLFANPNVPKELISRIHAKFVMVTIVEPTLSEFADRIRNKKIPVQGGDRKAYLNSLKTLVQWYGEAVGLQQRGKAMTGASPQTRSDEFARILAGLSGDPDPDARLDAVEQVKIALEYLRDDRVFAKDILKTHVATLSDPKTVNAAVAEIANYYEPRTKVGPGSVDGIEYWFNLFTELDRAGKSYANLLALANDLADTDKFESTAEVFLTETQDIEQIDQAIPSAAAPNTFSNIWHGLPGYLSTEESHLPRFADGRIQRLTELFDDVKKEWEGEFAILEGALAIGAKSGGTTDVESTYTEINARKKSLADSVSKSLEELKSKFGIAGEGDPLKYYEDQSLVLVKRAPDGREHIEMSSGAYGTGAWLKHIIADLRVLAAVGGSKQPLPPLAEWPEQIKKMQVQEPAKLATARTFGIWHGNVRKNNAADNSDGRRRNEFIEKNARFVKGQTYWKPVKLFDLAESIWDGHKYVVEGRTLDRMIGALQKTLDESPPGLARLVDKFDVKARDLPFDSHRFNRLRRTPAAQPAQKDREEEGRRDGRRRRRSRPAEPDSAEGQTRRQRAADMLLTQYHTREFLLKTLRLYKTIEQSLPQESKWANLRTALSDSAEKYVLGYFGDWYALYSDYTQLLDVETLDFIVRCRDQKITWPEFQSWMTNRDGGDAMLKTLGKRMEALARETVYFEDMLESNATDDEIYELIKGQLDVLKGRGASIVEVLDDLRDYQPTEGAAETLIANKMKAALREYLREVKALGDLTKTSKRTLELPDVAKLREQIVDPSYLDLDFRIVAPLIAIAEYGEKLLTHHLESNLAAIIEKHHGHYPLIPGNDIPSPNLDAKKLSDVIESAMSPDDFIALLRETAVFERDFGQVYRSDSSSVVGIATLDKCKLWRDFLYAKKGLSLSGKFEEPERRKLNIVVDTVDHPENTNDCGSICDSLTTSLPVFKIDSNAPINKILVPTRPSKADSRV
ncbi:MAG: hypothetical protein IID33_09930, partial [Planctomycetes bacterium]|nr:hypothetical protein [Planctomycetota bacterium]